ncbi:hypothetical protein LTR08_004052 [Meristemomyces frigidus]|nr:hypothetical protein LTR08_004052 [Meristemomyces frigidus]
MVSTRSNLRANQEAPGAGLVEHSLGRLAGVNGRGRRGRGGRGRPGRGQATATGSNGSTAETPAGPPSAPPVSSPAPAPNQAIPAPVSNQATPLPVSNQATPLPVSNQATPPPVSNQATPPPVSNQATPPPASNQAIPAPASNQATPPPVSDQEPNPASGSHGESQPPVPGNTVAAGPSSPSTGSKRPGQDDGNEDSGKKRKPSTEPAANGVNNKNGVDGTNDTNGGVTAQPGTKGGQTANMIDPCRAYRDRIAELMAGPHQVAPLEPGADLEIDTLFEAIAAVTEAVADQGGPTFSLLGRNISNLDWPTMARPGQEVIIPVPQGRRHLALVIFRRNEDSHGFYGEFYNSSPSRRDDRSLNNRTFGHARRRLFNLGWGALGDIAEAYQNPPVQVDQDASSRLGDLPQVGRNEDDSWVCGLHAIFSGWIYALGLQPLQWPVGNMRGGIYDDALYLVDFARDGLLSADTIRDFLACHDLIDRASQVPEDRRFANTHAFRNSEDLSRRINQLARSATDERVRQMREQQKLFRQQRARDHLERERLQQQQAAKGPFKVLEGSLQRWRKEPQKSANDFVPLTVGVMFTQPGQAGFSGNVTGAFAQTKQGFATSQSANTDAPGVQPPDGSGQPSGPLISSGVSSTAAPTQKGVEERKQQRLESLAATTGQRTEDDAAMLDVGDNENLDTQQTLQDPETSSTAGQDGGQSAVPLGNASSSEERPELPVRPAWMPPPMTREETIRTLTEQVNCLRSAPRLGARVVQNESEDAGQGPTRFIAMMERMQRDGLVPHTDEFAAREAREAFERPVEEESEAANVEETSGDELLSGLTAALKLPPGEDGDAAGLDSSLREDENDDDDMESLFNDPPQGDDVANELKGDAGLDVEDNNGNPVPEVEDDELEKNAAVESDDSLREMPTEDDNGETVPDVENEDEDEDEDEEMDADDEIEANGSDDSEEMNAEAEYAEPEDDDDGYGDGDEGY